MLWLGFRVNVVVVNIRRTGRGMCVTSVAIEFVHFAWVSTVGVMVQASSAASVPLGK